MQSCDLFILAGETSGDLHGHLIVESLLAKNPKLNIAAVAGPNMRKHPIDCVLPMENLQVMGFIDVLFSLPSLMRIFYQIRSAILKKNPRVVLCIDYPGLNLRLTRSLRKKGFQGKIIHYICPSVWAWGKKRIFFIEKYVDHLFSILPFEKKCFEQTSLAVTYVGNPLMSPIREKITDRKYITLFPGSRKKELEKNLKLQLFVVHKLCQLDSHLSVALSIAHPEHEAFIQKTLSHFSFPVALFSASDKELWMQKTFLALATSGTITLELALQKIPTVVNYAIRPFDEFLAVHIFRISLPFYCLVNIVAEKEVFPELFGHRLTQQSFFEASKKLLLDSEARLRCQNECQKIRDIFGPQKASHEVSHALLSFLATKVS